MYTNGNFEMKTSKLLFVGQGPSKDGDPYQPLEGDLAKRIGFLLRTEDFAETFARINLNSEWIGKVKGDGKGDVFDVAEGRTSAKVLLRGSWIGYVLLGKRVADCFDVRGEPLDTIHHGVKSFFLLPHPSGINRWWNDPENILQASDKLRTFVYD